MRFLKTLFQRHRRNALVRNIARRCEMLLTYYNNFDYDLRTNGEFDVLKNLARFPLRTFFDAGANVGLWSLKAAAYFTQASFHAFEVSPRAYEQLCAGMRGLPHAQCHLLGLSNSAEPTQFRQIDSDHALTTKYEFPHGLSFTMITAPMTTGDAYCREHGITHIDFLKMDVEGMEHLILQGFSEMIKNGGVDLIQFEYGRVNILTKYLLYDFNQFFKSNGYVIGKIFPGYVDFREYTLHDEDFKGPNYLACRANKRDYIAALQRG